MLRKFVITGGPCSGKTSTINYLKKQGYLVFQEAAREILQKFKKDSKGIDRDILQREIFKLQEKHIKRAQDSNRKIAFFDRGVGDTLAYYLFSGLNIPADLLKKARRIKYSRIFFLKPLNFYKKDEIRKEEKDEQEKISRFILKVYFQLDYNPIKVPFMTIKQRTDFIKKFI